MFVCFLLLVCSCLVMLYVACLLLCVYICVYIYIYIHTYVYTHVVHDLSLSLSIYLSLYMYIYIERERDFSLSLSLYIYIYMVYDASALHCMSTGSGFLRTSTGANGRKWLSTNTLRNVVCSYRNLRKSPETSRSLQNNVI